MTHDRTRRDRAALVRLAEETLSIIDAGQYTVDGRAVELRAAVDRDRSPEAHTVSTFTAALTGGNP